MKLYFLVIFIFIVIIILEIFNLYRITYKNNKPHIPRVQLIWSQGWYNLLHDTNNHKIPISYFFKSTENVLHKDELLNIFKNFDETNNILWLRQTSKSKISGNSNDVENFIDIVLPYVKNRFSLITSDGDNSMPSKINNAKKLLNNPYLIYWYTQNYDGSIIHEKLRQIPIGFNLHILSEKHWKSPQDQCKEMKNIRSSSKMKQFRHKKIFMDKWMISHPERQVVEELLKKIVVRPNNRISLIKLWKDYYTKYQFGISARGNGLDCHRTWEMLYFGMIPIVKTSSLDPLYEKFPVVIVNDWNEVKLEKLDEWANKYNPLFENIEEKFEINWWIKNAPFVEESYEKKQFTEFEIENYNTEFKILNDLAQNINNGFVEGNLGCPDFFKKRMSFVCWTKKIDPHSYMEIGFNAGHSTLMILKTATNIENILCFDIGHHKYVIPNFERLKKTFSNIKMELIIGCSNLTVPKYNHKKLYDLIHIDGGHSLNVAYADIINCRDYAHQDTIVILDDCIYDLKFLNNDNNKLPAHEQDPLEALEKAIKENIVHILFPGNQDIRHVVFKYNKN